MDTKQAVKDLLALPELVDSPAWERFDCLEYDDAAAYIAEDIYEFHIRVSEDQRAALLQGIRQYAHGDELTIAAYARLLEPENWKTDVN